MAGLSIVLLMLGSIAVGATGPAAADATSTPTAVTSGSLTWGFKNSFRNYIGGLTGTTVAGGATADAKAVATFPLVSGAFDPATNATDLTFGGSVQYRSHCEAGIGLPAGECALDMTFSSMRVVITPDEQTLYAHIVSRKLETGYPMTDFGTVAVANLSIADATVVTAAGTTTWAGITETSTAAAAEPTTYAAGTPFDVFGFSYAGAGGKPNTGESWTVPGTTALAVTHSQTSSVLQNGPQGLYVDDKNTSVQVLNSSTSFDRSMPFLSSYGYGGLAPKGTSSTIKAAESNGSQNATVLPLASDPARGRIFVTDPTGLAALTSNVQTGDYTHTVLDPSPPALLSAAWDAALNRLIAVTVDEDYTEVFLTEWTPADGTWARTDIPMPDPEGYSYVDYYTPSGNVNGPSLVALTDGTLILTRSMLFDDDGNLADANPTPLHLTVAGGAVAVAELTGATTQNGPDASAGEAGWVVSGPNGSFLLGTRGVDWGSSFVRMGQEKAGRATVSAVRTAIPAPAEESLVAAFDPTDGTAWVKGVRSGTLAGISGGKVFTSQLFQDTAMSYTIAVGADHEIYTGGRTQDVHARVSQISRIGVSPTIQSQPVSATVVDGGTAAFTAAATGTPAPTVQWQAQAPGAAKFADVAGATSTTLNVVASGAVNGTRYRAVFTNAAGALASGVAVLTVDTAPSITVQPTPQTAKAGDSTTFQVMTAGNPEPTVTWQRQSGGAWTEVGETDGFVLGQGTITVPNATAALNGLVLRARVANPVATIYSNQVTLTIIGGTVAGGTKPTVAGFLSWGVKSSFRSYITGSIASGWIAVSGGASAAGGNYVFPQTTGSTWTTEAGTGSGAYRGAVQFYGHGGVLNVTLSNPSVQIDSPTHATLYVSDNGSGPIGIGSVDLSKASVKVLDGGVSYTNAPVSLTGAGVGVFSYGSSQFYSAGEQMDPVSFTIGAPGDGAAGGGAKVTVASAAKKWTPPSDPPATTGITLASPTPDKLIAGATVTISADGFQANEKNVRLVIYSTPRILADDLSADADGAVTWTGALPADLTGQHTLTLQGSVNRGVVLDIATASTIGQCTVDGATLTWGFKESFRAYIQSSIANGSWTEAGGASYATPNFGWSAGTGSLNPTTGAALVTFAGTVNFTGHQGVLNTTIGNPQIQLVDDTTAFLLLDVSGPTMDGKPTDFRGASFVKLDLTKSTVTHNPDGSITASDVPATLTADGTVAFPNYPAGTAMDPVSFTIPVDKACGTPVPVDRSLSGSAGATPTSHVTADYWWILWVGVGLLVVAAIVALLLVRRRRTRDSGANA
jgi:hypothetical protein